jgi:hypothetical protein
MKFSHDPYRFQVISPEEFVVAILDGKIVGNIPISGSHCTIHPSQQKEVHHLLCYVAFKKTNDPIEITWKDSEKTISLGSIHSTFFSPK